MKLRVYKDAKREWRWSVASANGKILADSGQGYTRKVDCLSALETVTNGELLQMVKNDLQLLINAINERE